MIVNKNQLIEPDNVDQTDKIADRHGVIETAEYKAVEAERQADLAERESPKHD